MKRMLMIASVPSMIGQFNMNNIQILLDLGYEIDVACNWNDKSVWTENRIKKLEEKLTFFNVNCYQVDFSRDIFNFKNHIKAYKQLKKIFDNNGYMFFHTHTPIASAISRFVNKKRKVKCIYTAHGFHFYKGAPLTNWFIFYPLEKYLSRCTDILITINKEDYQIAKTKFKMKKIEYVPGIGIDLDYIENIQIDKYKLREKLNIPKDNKVIISVGELSKRKNHEVVIKALKDINNITYLICGQGNLDQYLKKLAIENNIDLHLLGFRSDRLELIKMSDIFVFPSLQEGLPVALMEAMACEIPCVASKIRGNTDLIEENINGLLFNPNNIDELVKCIDKIINNNGTILANSIKYNIQKGREVSLENISKMQKQIYEKIL